MRVSECVFSGCVGALSSHFFKLVVDFRWRALRQLHSQRGGNTHCTSQLRQHLLQERGRQEPCPCRCQLQEGRRYLACSIYLNEDTLRIKHHDVAFRGEFLTMGHRDLCCLHGHPQGQLRL